MNEIIKALYARKSVRVFTEEEISKEDKESILSAALQAPSAGCQLLEAGGLVRPSAFYRKSKNGAGILCGLPEVAFLL